jgi:DNA-binding phage protein
MQASRGGFADLWVKTFERGVYQSVSRGIIKGVNKNRRDDVPEAFSTALRVEIARARLSNNEVARRAGISAGLMSKFVNGIQTPRVTEYFAIADALGIDPLDLYDSMREELRRMAGEEGGGS